MRTMHRFAALPAALLLGFLPVSPLLGQQDGGMKKDGAMEDHAAMAMDKPTAQGKLIGMNGHRTSGTVHVVNAEGKGQLHFTPDFSAEKSPDVYVMLTKGPKPVKDQSVVVAKLTRFSGEQTFDLPAGTNPAGYSHVVLWNRKRDQALGQAALHTDGMGKGDGMMEKDGAMMKEGGAQSKQDGMMEKDGMDKDGMKKQGN